MPGGYGIYDTPWGSGGTSSTPSRPERNTGVSAPDRDSGGQGSNNVADVVNDPRSTQADISNAIALAGQSGGGGMTYSEQAAEKQKQIQLQAALSMAAAGISNVGGREAGPGVFSITDPYGVNWDDSTYGLLDYNPNKHGPGTYWFNEEGWLEDYNPTYSDGYNDQGGWGGGYRGGGGDDGGLGWMLPRPGQRPEQMAGFYTPQANLQQAMVNVHSVPTGFQMKRGGIVSLLRLGS